MEIKVGRVYRAKKPAVAGGCYYNDRQVVYMDLSTVQYDGPAVGDGRRYPCVDRRKFEDWAGSDVTDRMPEGGWEVWCSSTANSER